MFRRATLITAGLVTIVSSRARAQDDHIRRIYWSYDSSGYHFDPQQLTVGKGDTVRFLARAGVPHSIVFIDSALELDQRNALARTLAQIPRAGRQPLTAGPVENVGETINIPTDSLLAGRYPFACGIHGFDGETGVLIVQDGPVPPPPAPPAEAEELVWSTNDIDSLVLQRTGCSSGCPAYAVSVNRDGAIRFRGTANTRAKSGTASLSSGGTARLFARVDSSGFFMLPETTDRSSTLCSVMTTDRPTLTVTAFGTSGLKKVSYNTGCMVSTSHGLVKADELKRLNDWAAVIDSAAGVDRWIH